MTTFRGRLLDRYGLGEIPWLVDIETAGNSNIVSQLLEWDDAHQGLEEAIRCGDVDDLVGDGLDARVSLGGNGDDVRPTSLDLVEIG